MNDVLPSWRPGPAREAIVEFVEAVSGGPDSVPPEDRVAVFDNDGTLWTEKPMPTQLHYIVEQWAAAASADPTLAEQQPYKAVVERDLAWLGAAIDKHYAGDDSDLKVMIGALLGATAHQSVDDYQVAVSEFYRTAEHQTLGRAYSGVVYRPMLELLRYLEAHDFVCYIVSGGSRDFMRPMTVDYYGIPPERVVGTAEGLEYDADTNQVRYGTSLQFFDDGPEKPIRIWTRTGRRPILAGGNANGDLEMLRYVQGHPRSLSLLVHHDDDTGRGDAPYDKGADRVLAAVEEHGFVRVSVKDDWAQVFPD
jgi:phosphoglycolate phosphatase-like HAD superfamily hydrolase